MLNITTKNALNIYIRYMAKICIVLATYNGEKYLQEMLNSLASQTRPADKIIAVDDGSSDSTPEILKRNQGELPLQLILCNENHGHRAAFSKGLEEAQKNIGENDFIALADQDDIWLPEKLEILEKEIGNASLVFGDAKIIDQNGDFSKPSWRAFAKIDSNCTMKHQIAGINNVTGCLSLFRANLLTQILPIPENVTVHDRWVAMFALKNGGVTAIPQIVAKYRIHGNNAVGGAQQASMSKTLATQQKWLEQILEYKQKLKLDESELNFATKLLELNKRRSQSKFAISYLPWIFANRKFLFLNSSLPKTIRRVVFTAVGLPFAKKYFGKE